MSWYQLDRNSGLKGMIQYDMSAIRLMPDGPEQLGGAVSRRSNHMKRKSTLQLIVILLAVMFALFSFTACNDNPNAPPETGEEQAGNPDDNPNAPPETGEEQTGNPDDNPPEISDEEALTGQWLVYQLDDKTQEMEFFGVVIDIQYTAPGYWIMADMQDISDSIAHSRGFKVQSNRTLQEDGWFFISFPEEEMPYEIRYRFIGSDRNTLETHITDGQNAAKLELRRVTGRVIGISEEEPK